MIDLILDKFPGIQPDRRGEYHVDCPACGKETKRGEMHFSFSERGYCCFVCGARGSLKDLADKLNVTTSTFTKPEPKQQETPVRAFWRDSPGKLLGEYWSHPDRFEAWQRYKPVSRETIVKHNFGYGRLPFASNNGMWYRSRANWLIVPLFEDNKLVGLRGRNVHKEGTPKWISATGTSYVLWGVEDVKPCDTTWLCENYVDAAWLMQEHPEYKAVALGGARMPAAWGAQLAAKRPSQAIVALDNDLAGQASGEMLEELQRDWIKEHPGLTPPAPNGPNIANDLLARRIKTLLFKWPANAPAKAGVDWLLRQEQSG